MQLAYARSELQANQTAAVPLFALELPEWRESIPFRDHKLAVLVRDIALDVTIVNQISQDTFNLVDFHLNTNDLTQMTRDETGIDNPISICRRNSGVCDKTRTYMKPAVNI